MATFPALLWAGAPWQTALLTLAGLLLLIGVCYLALRAGLIPLSHLSEKSPTDNF